MRQMRKQQGFTLVELLVVIGIIVILAAILYPVFQQVREKARQAQCRSNLSQIATAIKGYRTDHGLYPFAPYFDASVGTTGRYLGGISALYPDYISDKGLLVCPDDRQISSRKQAAADVVYSSYNGEVELTTWAFAAVTGTNPDGGGAVDGAKRTYNFEGYCHEGWDVFAYHATVPRPYANTLPAWLRDEGMSYRHYPRLQNRNAPDNTFITHCVHHRAKYGRETSKMDVVVNLGGKATMNNISQMGQPGADAAHPSKWVWQKP